MVLFLARAIMAVLGIIYVIIGGCMTAIGLVNEISIRIFEPVLLFVYGFTFEDKDYQNDHGSDDGAFKDKDYVPFIIAGIITLFIGASFLANIP